MPQFARYRSSNLEAGNFRVDVADYPVRFVDPERLHWRWRYQKYFTLRVAKTMASIRAAITTISTKVTASKQTSQSIALPLLRSLRMGPGQAVGDATVRAVSIVESGGWELPGRWLLPYRHHCLRISNDDSFLLLVFVDLAVSSASVQCLFIPPCVDWPANIQMRSFSLVLVLIGCPIIINNFAARRTNNGNNLMVNDNFLFHCKFESKKILTDVCRKFCAFGTVKHKISTRFIRVRTENDRIPNPTIMKEQACTDLHSWPKDTRKHGFKHIIGNVRDSQYTQIRM